MAAVAQVVCPFFGVVFERLKSLIYKDHIKKLGPLVKELKKLYKTFCKIKEVLNDAEERQFKGEADGIRLWLQELNDAAYEADDVLDDFEYEEGLQQLASEEATSSSNNVSELHGKIQTLNKNFHELAEECSGLELRKEKEKSVVVSPERITISLSTEPKVHGRDEDREKLVKQLLGSAYLTLDQFRTRGSNYCAKHPTASRGLVLNEASSSSSKDPISVFPILGMGGLGSAYSTLDQFHTHPKAIQGAVLNNVSSSGSQDNISVFPILGMGGLGKTTLAQLVYNDKRVENYFKDRSWVCVSDDFDIKRLMKAIVASISGSECNLEDLELLQQRLRKDVHGKRFLLVLDDVWEENHEEWNKMMRFFEGGAQGSAIIVTTRLPTVASITSKLPPHCLNGLSRKDCWALFKQSAFGQGNEESEALVKIGKAIVEKCVGLPLAAKAMGGLLRFKNEENEWNEVRDSAIWELPQSSVKDILPALRLSYYHLPSMLKQCFVYCSIFPKDFDIEKEMLIKLWMANGLVQSRAKIELEDVGNEIFTALLQRSFFQNVKHDEDIGKTTCKMHDLVHDLASHIAGDEYFVEDVGSARNITERTRHLSLLSYGEGPHRSLPCLRSLIQLSEIHAPLQFVFSDFILLRALDLNLSGIEVVPDCIGEMTHLRYLDLSYNDFTSLPESICRLRNMQTLRLSCCTELESLPENFGNMSKLRHLNIENCHSLGGMPIGIGQLTRLQTLSHFMVGKGSRSGIGGLQLLNNLRENLIIRGLWLVKTSREAKDANLMSKENVHALRLIWSNYSKAKAGRLNRRGRRRQRKVMEGLQPHVNVRILFVQGYQGVTSPTWLTPLLVPNLVEIYLYDCTWQHLGSLRKFPSLKVLKLSGIDSLKFIEEKEVVDDASAGGGFPSLEELFLRDMPDLEGWSSSSSSQAAAASAEEGFQWLEGVRLEEPMHNLEGSSSSTSQAAVAPFPCLKSQSAKKKLERCPKLKTGGGLPLLLSQAAATTQVAAVFPCLKSVTIYNCPKLRGGIPLAWSPVQDVKINGYKCNGMVLASLRDLPSLPSLNISGFDELEYFPSGTLTNLTALHKLEISDCRNLKALPVELYSLTTLAELQIFRCPKLVSLAEERQGGLKSLPSLKTLFIDSCAALERLPELNKASLVTLKVIDCPEMEFSKEDFEHLEVLEELRLVGLPKLTCFPEEIKHSAATLRQLQFQPRYIQGAVVDLPDWIGTILTSLEYLKIYAPKNWKVLPQRMQQLVIYECNEEQVERGENRDWQREDDNCFNMIAQVPQINLSSYKPSG